MNRALVATLVTFILACALPIGAQQPPPNLLPPGDGREIVATACTQCHGARAFVRLRQGGTAWRDTVYQMVQLGAQVAPQDMDAVVVYLASHFGPGMNLEPSAKINFPDGAGKVLAETRCVLCHGADRVVDAKRSPRELRAVVDRMVYLGAPLTGPEAKTIVEYLAAHYGSSST